MAAETVLPSCVADQPQPAVGVDEEAARDFIVRPGTGDKIFIRRNRKERLPHFFKGGAFQERIVLGLPRRFANQKLDVPNDVRKRRVEPAISSA